MVLHLGDDDLITRLHTGLPESGRHEIDAFGGAACEDDFCGGMGIYERPYCLTCLLVEACSLLREVVDTTVHVGIDIQVLFGDGIDDALRFLRRGAVVEIDERAAVNGAGEDRENPDPSREGGEGLA